MSFKTHSLLIGLDHRYIRPRADPAADFTRRHQRLRRGLSHDRVRLDGWQYGSADFARSTSENDSLAGHGIRHFNCVGRGHENDRIATRSTCPLEMPTTV